MEEKEFQQLIDKMLKDAAKGWATSTELRQAIDEVIAKKFAEDEALKSIKTIQTAIDENKKATDLIATQINTLLKTRFAAIKDADGHYNGAWGSVMQAKNFGLFLMGDVVGNPAAKKLLDESGVERAKAITGSEYAIPAEFIPRLIDMLGTYGVYRADAFKWPMASDSSSCPKQTGDPTVYCPGAGVAPTAGSLTLGNVGLTAKKWITFIAIPRETVEDMAIAVGEIVGRSIARAFAHQEDLCGFIGDGTSTYFNELGIDKTILAVHATPASIPGLRIQATAGTWAAIVIDDILALPGLITDDADDGVNCKWYGNKNFYHTVILKLALALGGTSAQEAIYTGYTQRPQFMGRDFRYTRVMPKVKAAADHIPLILGNLQKGSILGDRRSFELAQDSSVYFTSDQIAIRGTSRVTMNNHGVGDTSEAGALVALLADIA